MKTRSAAAVGLALVVLYLIFSSDLFSSDLFCSSAPPESTSVSGAADRTVSKKGEASTSRGGEHNRNGRAGQGELEAPAAPIPHGVDPAGKPVVRSYELADGTKVYDHRANPSEPNLDGYVVLPKTVSKVQPTTLVAVRGALRPAMTTCIDKYGLDAAEGARVQASITVSIHDELLRIDKLRVQISGLAEEEGLRSCVTDEVLGHEQIVAGAQDVAAHRMTFPYDL